MNHRLASAVVAIGGVAVAMACTLNPQPLPPGDQNDAGFSGATGSSGGGSSSGSSGSSAGGSSSGSGGLGGTSSSSGSANGLDAAIDGSVVRPDAGEVEDGGDGGPGDAGADAPTSEGGADADDATIPSD